MSVRPRASTRPGSIAWSRVRARLERTGGGDEGFTMVEMIVALVIIGIIMTALGTYFVSTVSATSRQGTKQAAVQLTDDSIELVRAVKGSAVVTGRDYTSSLTQWNAPASGVAAYQADMIMASDSAVTTGGASATLPTVGKQVTINGLVYTRNWYVGSCWQPTGGGVCGKTVDSVPFYRVVVSVTWTDTVCASSTCSYVASTLVSNATTEPLFNSNLTAQAPKVTQPGSQVSDQNVTITPVLMSSTGGAGAITWSFAGLPTGLTGSSDGTISGKPTAINTFSVIASATDGFSLVGTASFSWQVVAPPVITATNQSSVRGTNVSYAPTVAGGSGTMYWDASANLPAGLTIDHGTGVVSGVPTTTAAAVSVTLSVKDGQNITVTKIITWAITTPATLTITTPGTQTSAGGVAITALSVTKAGGVAPYTWSATNVPDGLTFDTTSGQFSGTPTNGARYSVTVTVTDSSSQTASTTAFTWNVLDIITPTVALASDRSTTITPITARAAVGSGNYTWTTTAGTGGSSIVKTLPPGITLNGATGLFSGTPTASSDTTYNFNLVVTDTTTGLKSTQNLTWVIANTPIIISPNTNQFGAVNRAVSLTATSANFTDTPTWSATGLPTGLNMSTGGVISGTPTVAGTYTVTITATYTARRVNDSDTQSFTWTVEASPPVATAPTGPRSVVRNRAITAVTATATGGMGNLTWSATGLPSGLSISAAGVISGTTANAGSTSNTVLTVTDAYGVTDTLSFTWTVT